MLALLLAASALAAPPRAEACRVERRTCVVCARPADRRTCSTPGVACQPRLRLCGERARRP